MSKESPVQHIYLKQNSYTEGIYEDDNPNLQTDLEKIAFYASRYIDTKKQKNDCFAILKALSNQFSEFQSQISKIANMLPALSDERRDSMLKEENLIMKEMQIIREKMSYDMNMTQNQSSLRPLTQDIKISLKKENENREDNREDNRKDNPKDNPKVKVMISTFSDNRGSKENNILLSSSEPYHTLWKDSISSERGEESFIKGGKKNYRLKTVRGVKKQ